MGNLGFRVIQRLVERGVSCVAVDPREDNPFLDAARRLGVPVVTADAAQEETLDDLRADRARALLAVTSDDLANLETALNGRTHAPQLPVVVRLYDADLADRVGRAFDIHVARSVSAIAGATFTARLVGRKLLATVPVGSRALVVAEVPAPGALTVGQLERRYGVRVLEADGTWRPDGLHPVEAGGALVVLGTKDAVGSLAPAA
jgi:Trk K+ transport system NAD-binding subunit